MHQNQIILASASQRRQQLLAQMGLAFRVVVPEVAEVHWNEHPVDTAMENATRKCRQIAGQYPASTIIAADTIVVCDGAAVGKPQDMAEAQGLLRRFSGRMHDVFTALALQLPGNPLRCEAVRSAVQFRELSDAQIQYYLQHVNPLDKAGGYNIDEYGELIIARHEGSHSNIMGLPIELLAQWLGLDQ